MMPHDLIFLTFWRVQSQFQREEEYFAFLGTFDRCYNPTLHSDRREAYFQYLC